MTRNPVVLCLSRDVDEAKRLMAEIVGRDEVAVLASSQLQHWSIPRCDDFGVAGSPPRDEIGYGLAVVAAGSARPERVR